MTTKMKWIVKLSGVPVKLYSTPELTQKREGNISVAVNRIRYFT
jgi:hypothetical protein